MPDSTITKKALANAMKMTMSKKPFHKIRVGDICEECGMNRKSFYYHFKDKYDLVEWIIYTEMMTVYNSKKLETALELLEAISCYLYANRTFYINAFDVHGQNSFREFFSDLLKPMCLEHTKDFFSTKEEQEVFAEFYADAFLASLEKWLTYYPNFEPKAYAKLMYLPKDK